MRHLALLAVLVPALGLAGQVPTPKEFLGHDVCEDFYLANYSQYRDYLAALAKNSDRIKITTIGQTEWGRPQVMAIISDPSNLRNLDKIRKDNERIARAGGFKSDDDALATIKNAKSVVWIDGGLHANETLVAQHLIEMAYSLCSSQDDEAKRILKDTVVLLVHANPDGMDLVANWYMRRPEPKDRSLAGLPELYQKYCGHDNNRDFYAANMAETKNMNRVMYQTWYPQIVYNHHQSAPAGTIMFVPPFRNPFNYHMDPITEIGTDLVGTHIHQRLISEGKKGTAMRGSTLYSTWWNGGLRTTAYFHNMIGILTETWGSPNPGPLPFVPKFQIPSTDVPFPVEAGKVWHLRDSLQYEISANYAILDYASRYRERVLWNNYRAARNQIELGRRDSWTGYPSRIAKFAQEALTRPDLRDAKAYVIPPQGNDRAAVTKFCERMASNGVEIEVTSAASGDIPAGSVVIRCDQAFRPHVLDMFEPQDHPNDLQYPGGPPIPPYDSAGYTLAFQMGIKFKRLLDTPKLALAPLNLDKPLAAFADRDKMVNTKATRVALWDTYGGSMESGWTRWILEQYKFKFDVVFPPTFGEGGLRSKYDCIIFPDGGLPGAPSAGGRNLATLMNDPTIDEKYKKRMGGMDEKALAALRAFVAEGGHIVCIGSSSLNAIKVFDLPVKSALVDDAGKTLPNTKFYIPGSIMQISLAKSALTEGCEEKMDVMFDNSPAFVAADPSMVVASYASESTLRSGWALGQERLKGTAAIVDVPVGKGRVILFGPEMAFRGQPIPSLRPVFNAIWRSGN
jgi:hypothetical protein